MSFLKKIQNLPERKRKIILWSVVIIIGLILFVFWIKNVQQKLKIFEKEKIEQELQLPSLREKLKEIPKIKIPNI
jgi:type II secretory pathway component PulM